MRFTETRLPGAFLIDLDRVEDERGFFARAWCAEEFAERGLCSHFVQSNISVSKKRGTLRGLHYQAYPHQEAKLVRCTRGVVYDIIVDLRPDSPTYKQWLGVELRANDYRMLYVAEGFAHGFQTLMDDTEVFYPVSHAYVPEAERGIRWNDLAFNIRWPETDAVVISDKDRGWPDCSL